MADPTEHLVLAADGWRLSVLDLPAVGEAQAVAIAGHAMMVDRRTLLRFDRPCLATTLAARGLRVLVPDQRGHGASGPTARQGGRWTYDDLAADTATYVALAQDLAPGLPVVGIGHSLFGHTALAWLGQHPETPLAGLVALGANLWGPAWEPRLTPQRAAARAAKHAIFAAAAVLARTVGYLPVKAAAFGSADEPLEYWRTLERTLWEGRWVGADGTDYRAHLARVRCPVLQVLSDGDPFFANPDEALGFLAPLGPRREVLRLGRRCPDPRLAGLSPGHVSMATSPRCQPLWEVAADWLLAAARR